MKLVIDIPEEIYLNVKKDYLYDTEVIINAFKNGTPLPKGHGRLHRMCKLCRYNHRSR